MNIRTQIIVAAIMIGFLAIIINMTRKKSLELRYALAWMAAAVGILIFDIFPGLTTVLSETMGIATPVNMLFFLGFCFALIIIFVLTVAVSRLSVRMKKMAQELALYKKEGEENK